MKITIYELLGMVKDGKAPKKIKYKNDIYEYEDYDYFGINRGYFFDRYNVSGMLNEEVEIIEEKKKFTKEDFINERMGIDKITRKEFDEIYEVKECNCGMPYCKGFIAVDKEEPQEHKIPKKLEIEQDTPNSNFYIRNEYGTKCALTKHSKIIADKINEIIDYLEEIE